MTDGVGVLDGLGVIDAERDRLVSVELLAEGKPYRALDGREEGPATWVIPPVWSGLVNDCDIDENGDNGVDVTPDDKELFFACKTSAVVMLPWARVELSRRKEE